MSLELRLQLGLRLGLVLLLLVASSVDKFIRDKLQFGLRTETRSARA